MKRSSSLYIMFMAVVMSLLTASCNDWLTLRPNTEIEKDKLFSVESGFWEALTGTYALFLNENNNYGLLRPLRTSGIEYMAGVWTTSDRNINWMLKEHMYKDPQADQELGNIFLNQYSLIAHVNTILAYVDQADFLPESSASLIKGEALAIRAYVHFDLIRLWGPIPSHVDDGKRYLPYMKEVSKKAKTYNTYNEYMAFLQEDIDAALALLGKSDPLLKYTCEETAKVGKLEYKNIHWYWRQNKFNYYSVLGLKARVALWKGAKEEALKYAQEVINAKNTDGSNKFRLGMAADLERMTDGKANNNTLREEHLFSLAVNGNQNHMQWFPPWFHLYPYKISALFDDVKDFRYKMWFVEEKEPLKMSSYKYKNSNSEASNPLWLPMLRLAEMYLIAIEAADLPTANSLYEKFCLSRGITFKPLAENDRLYKVLMEYYKEFNIEGQIFFANKRMNVQKTMWISEDMLEQQYVLPIPRKEFEIFN